MQDYLPFIEAQLTEWYRLSVDNTLYAATIAATTWFITALIYGLRIGSLNKRNAANIAARDEARNQLQQAEQQLSQLLQTIAEQSAALETERTATENEAQRAQAFEELMSQRNKSLLRGLQNIAMRFNLSDVIEDTQDIEANTLWQQLQDLIDKAAERLVIEQQATTVVREAFQAEKTRTAELQSQLTAQQTRLNDQAGQIAQLQAAGEEYENLLQQSESKQQQLLAEQARLKQSEQSRIAESEQQVLTSSQPEVKAVEPVVTTETTEKPPIEPQEPDQAIEPPINIVKPVVTVETEQPVVEKTANAPKPGQIESAGGFAGKIKNLFGSAVQKASKLDEKLGSGDDLPKSEPYHAAVEAPEVHAAVVTPVAVVETPTTDTQPSLDAVPQSISGKFKKLFEKNKAAAPVVGEAVPVPAPTSSAVDTAPAEEIEMVEVDEVAEELKKLSGQLKGLFGKFRK